MKKTKNMLKQKIIVNSLMQNLNSHSLQRMCVFFLMTITRLSYKAIVISNTNSDAKKKIIVLILLLYITWQF